MKKIICIFLGVFTVLTLTSCDMDEFMKILENYEDMLILEEMPYDEAIEYQTVPNEAESARAEQDTEKDDKDSEKDDSDKTDSNGSESTENVQKDVLKNVYIETISIPENIKLIESGRADVDNKKKINVDATVYGLDGDIVNWTMENNLLYVITEGNNRLVVLDLESMKPVYNVSLAGTPAEINVIGNKIYISLPDLCRIDIFSKSGCQKVDTLYFDNSVSSFCIDGDYIYYSEQYRNVFKKNLVTNQLTAVVNENGYKETFSEPKVLLNKDDGILYIGESGTTGSGIYYYDADTLTLKSKFKKDDYGISNNTRQIFHVGDEIFWGNYCLSDTDAKVLIARYGAADYGSVEYASEDIVATHEGIFLTDTYECIVKYSDYNLYFDHECVIVSENYNFFFRDRAYFGDKIIGINFDN